MPVQFRKFITRYQVQSEPDTLFVFGDNMAGKGFGGQAAEMRGEPNAVGIPTKWTPTRNPTAFFQDHQLPQVVRRVDVAILRLREHLINGGVVVLPWEGVGTGRAGLVRHAPLINEYIQSRLRELVKKYPA